MNRRLVTKPMLLVVKDNFRLKHGQWTYQTFTVVRAQWNDIFEFNFMLHVTSNFFCSICIHLGWDGVVGTANHYELNRPGFELWWAEEIFSSLYLVGLALQPT
jgi:hypothetical protein